MDEGFAWIKSHPYVVVGGIGALVLFYLLYSSSGSSAQASTGTTGPSDAAVQAGAAVQIAQLQAGAQSNQLNASLSAEQNNNATAITIAGLQSQVANYQTEQSANVQEAGIAAQQAVSLAGIQSQQAIAIANAATEAQIVSLNDQTTQVSYQEQTKQLQAVENANVQIAQTSADVAKYQAKHSGGFFGGGGFLGLGI